MNTNGLPKYCIFNFPPSELSKVKCKSDYLGNEISCLVGWGPGGLSQRDKMAIKTEKCSRLEVTFPLQCRLLILGSHRKQSLGQKFTSCGLMQEGNPGGARQGWWNALGYDGGTLGKPVLHVCFILQMHTLVWLLGPCDALTCVTSWTMESETSNSMPPTGQNPPHQAPVTPHFS